MKTTSLRAALALTVSAFAVLSAGHVMAADAAISEGKAEVEVKEITVTAPKGKAAAVAPVKAPLTATEPEAIITRKTIEEATPRIGDFTTTAILAPSMAGTPNANGPGATDGAKITMRGFQDGEFNITYDGIAWGDTNGPSHHANSFFPNSTIGGVVVDRGPGNATDLGQANFGGQLNLFSLPLESAPAFRQTLTVASFQTNQSVTTLATGPIDKLHGLNIVANFMEYNTNGYLTNSPADGKNQFIKFSLPVTSNFVVTALYTHNDDEYNQGDSNSTASVLQTEAYGKRFALSNNPNLQTYKGYNYTKKQTDFEYVRENWDIGNGFKAENTTYSYWYSNKTLSAKDGTADETIGALGVVGSALTKANVVTLNIAGAPYPVAGCSYTSKKSTVDPKCTTPVVSTTTGLPGTGLPGYLKRNEYRVTGDVLKFTKDFDFGRATIGAMYEIAKTQRSRFDIDLLTHLPDYREKAALYAGASGTYVQEPLNVAYDEYSGWHQYQPFAQFEWRATDKLTITPGVKYVHFELHLEAPAIAVKNSIQPFYGSQTFTKTLPFLTANYRISPTWSAYAQYAQGFLVPDISAFYVNQPGKGLVPQESTNYQLGTVFSAGKFTFDGDIYYIDFQHKIQSITVTDPTSSLYGETYESNSGGATYKGIELQGSYVLPKGFGVFGNYSINDAVAKNDSVNPAGNGHQIAKAPKWTAAGGLRWEGKHLIVDGDSLIANLTDKWVGSQYTVAAKGSAAPTGIIKAYGEADLTLTYKFGHFSIEGQVINLGDSKDITAFKGSAINTATGMPYRTSAEGGGANLFTYQSGRSYQLTLKAAF